MSMNRQGDSSEPSAETPRRFKRYPYGPLYSRVVYAVACIVVGGICGITRFGDLLGSVGIGVAVLGVVAIPVIRWMARRGI